MFRIRTINTAHYLHLLVMNSSLRVLVFGTFDPLHAGHRDLFEQAASLGGYLAVVVARDTAINSQKGRSPAVPEHERLAAVAHESVVDEAMLGDADPFSYSLLATFAFDILALGYDQAPSDTEVRKILEALHKSHVKIVRLAPHRPDIYKSSLLRT